MALSRIRKSLKESYGTPKDTIEVAPKLASEGAIKGAPKRAAKDASIRIENVLQEWHRRSSKRSSIGGSISLVHVFSLKKNINSDKPGNTKGGSITVPLTSCLTGLD